MALTTPIMRFLNQSHNVIHQHIPWRDPLTNPFQDPKHPGNPGQQMLTTGYQQVISRLSAGDQDVHQECDQALNQQVFGYVHREMSQDVIGHLIAW